MWTLSRLFIILHNWMFTFSTSSRMHDTYENVLHHLSLSCEIVCRRKSISLSCRARFLCLEITLDISNNSVAEEALKRRQESKFLRGTDNAATNFDIEQKNGAKQIERNTSTHIILMKSNICQSSAWIVDNDKEKAEERKCMQTHFTTEAHYVESWGFCVDKPSRHCVAKLHENKKLRLQSDCGTKRSTASEKKPTLRLQFSPSVDGSFSFFFFSFDICVVRKNIFHLI